MKPIKEYKSPFPWFGGKSRAADLVWSRLGDVDNYVEPFFGSGAVMFLRPHKPKIETINDKDGFVSNFWRAVQFNPEETAKHADNPVNENDLHARHTWLLDQRGSLSSKLEGDPNYCDPQIAGWWVWGICCWIGSGWCSGNGPWQVVDGQLVHLGDAGQGVNRQLVHLGDAGQGVNRKREGILEQFLELQERLRNVRVCCGDWQRVCGPTPTFKHGLTGVFLDPPYADTAKRTNSLYREDCTQVAHKVREWAINNGDNPLMRIAVCGYDGEHTFPETWTVETGLATNGGYANQAEENNGNSKRERIWFSPYCIESQQSELCFDVV